MKKERITRRRRADWRFVRLESDGLKVRPTKIALSLLVVFGCVLCMASRVSASTAAVTCLAELAVTQKSALDDFGDEEEKPLEKKPEPAKPAEPPAAEEPEEEMPEQPPAEEKPEMAEPSMPAESEQTAPQPETESEEMPQAEEQTEPAEEKPKQPAPAKKEEKKEPELPEVAVHDVVYWRPRPGATPRSADVVLLQEYVGSDGLALHRIMKEVPLYQEKGKGVLDLGVVRIVEIEYYEERVGKVAAELVRTSFEDLQSPNCALVIGEGEVRFAEYSEKMLATAIAEHDSAVARGLRRGAQWQPVMRQPLVAARFNVRVALIDRLIAAKKPQEAERECLRLKDEVEVGPAEQAKLASRLDLLFGARAQEALDRGDYAGVRTVLEQVSQHNGGRLSPRTQEIWDGMVAQAKQLQSKATAIRQTEPQQAIDLLEQARAICPSLGGLDDMRRGINEDYPILRCAYTSLPSRISPVGWQSAAQRHAAALVFESLVQWVDDPKAGAHYDCELAERPPIPLVRGRGFRLASSKWSDSDETNSHRCTVEDVRWTVKMLRNPACPGYSPAWAELLSEVENAPDGSPFTAILRLRRDHWQPMSMMDFRVLPSHWFFGASDSAALKEKLAAFSQRPVGTGPYRLADQSPEGSLRFIANPNYREPGLPKIREIVFQQYDALKMVDGFLQKDQKVHLVYDLNKEHVNQLDQHGAKVVALETPAVWFLAPNHRKPLLQNRNLRLAIAHAIDREAILNQFFGPGRGQADHVALTGPYPRDCWAYNADVEPFRPAQAATLVNLAKEELKKTQPVDKIRLTLAYPRANPDVEAACREIQKQVAAIGIELELSGLEPETFQNQIAVFQNFDLAYWCHQYEDSTYWIEPLLDGSPAAREHGGLNFMGYVPDQTMAGFFRDVRLHKQFRQIQDLTHKIHEHIARNAIVIPLWQLKTYVAVSDRLEDARLDPFVLYGDVERWTLRAR